MKHKLMYHNINISALTSKEKDSISSAISDEMPPEEVADIIAAHTGRNVRVVQWGKRVQIKVADYETNEIYCGGNWETIYEA